MKNILVMIGERQKKKENELMKEFKATMNKIKVLEQKNTKYNTRKNIKKR